MPSEQEPPEVRCFARNNEPGKRRGIWVMTQPTGYRGAFFHGDRCEVQAPRYTVEELSEWAARGGAIFAVEELSLREAMEELERGGWPEAAADVVAICGRHGMPITAASAATEE